MATKILEKIGFHAAHDYNMADLHGWTIAQKHNFTYDFENFFHPFVGELIEKLNKEALSGMLDPQFHEKLGDRDTSKLPESYYTPNPAHDEHVRVNFHNK
ncbi:MAG TPA: hypothetical protein ENJ16_03450, partial [Planctomycetaceae bacterium]|nr:hypothetical protein [Planctomycetaceae bacterium]